MAVAVALLTLVAVPLAVNLAKAFVLDIPISLLAGPPELILLRAIATGILLLAIRACMLVRSSHAKQQPAAREAMGTASAFMAACAAQPDALATRSPEQTSAWLRHFRNLSTDVLVADEGAAKSMGDIPVAINEPEVALVGISRPMVIAIASCMTLAIIAVLARLGIGGPDSHLHWISGLAGGGAILALLLRQQRRNGGQRTVTLGRFRDGSSVWTPADAVMALRRSHSGKDAFFKLDVIGTAGMSSLVLPDWRRNRQRLQAALSLWIAPTVRTATAAFREAGHSEVAARLGISPPEGEAGSGDSRWVAAMTELPGRLRPDAPAGTTERMALEMAAIIVIWSGTLATACADGEASLDFKGLSLEHEMAGSGENGSSLSAAARVAVDRLGRSVSLTDAERASLYRWLDLRAKSMIRRHWPEIERTAADLIRRHC